MKAGTPSSEVATPTGSSRGASRVRAAVSTHTRKTAPTSAVIGSSRRCAGPVSARAACGSTSPTKPIAPDELTSTAVSSAVTSSSTSRTRRTRTPSEAAASGPKAKASSASARARHTVNASANAPAPSATSPQSAEPSDPSSQNSTPRVCSASAEVNTMSEVSAENSCMPAMPDSSTRSVVPPEVCASSSTSPKESAAPAKAPADSDSAPPPTPSTTTVTAPVEAPEETPSTNGSASGLRSSDCSTAPHSPRPAPHTAASRARGRRSCHTMPSRSGDRPASAPPSRSTTTRQESPMPMAACPAAMAAATDTASVRRPSTQKAVAPRPVRAALISRRTRGRRRVG